MTVQNLKKDTSVCKSYLSVENSNLPRQLNYLKFSQIMNLAKSNPAFQGSKQKLEKESIELESREKTQSDEPKQISLFELFQYSDIKDKFLLLIGCITAFGSACVYPLMFFLYGQVASTFIDQEKFNRLNSTLNSSIISLDNKSIQWILEQE
ncbi:Multidrug resistance [Brachionus plicatilis]|uniref:Multidrug resistance n=1 Tax=Brachionus plicatilis TaxID=10195 RepID=A0A3M7PVI3_BRAPC|nr:Multidrug resistance [Brachionus plicatilis]